MKIHQKGLTLIEIIVSLAILSMIMINVIEVTDDSISGKDSIIAEDRELLQIVTALDRFDWDFSQIYTPMYHTQEFKIDPNNQKNDQETFKKLKENPLYSRNGKFSMPTFHSEPIPIFQAESKDSFEFLTKSHRRRRQGTKQSEYAWVKYEFRSYSGEDESKKGLFEFVRYYAPVNIYNNNIDYEEIRPYVLADNIKEFAFEYWDSKKSKFIEGFRSISNADRMMRGIKIKIVWVRSNDETEETLSRTFRTVWPYFEPEDLNQLKYQKDVNPQGAANGR